MKDAPFTAGHLLALYDRVVEAEDAIPRLRRFVLDLAVRGKLVEQDPTDEPAAELLKRIAIERNARVNSGEIRKGRPNDPVEAGPWDTPSRWVWLPLGDTGNIFTGNSIDAATRDRLEKTTEGRPFVATKDVGYGLDPIAYENGLLVSASDRSFKVARANSVLICAEGGSAGRKIGLTDREICFGNKLLANETWSVVSPRYVLLVYQSRAFYKQFLEQMTGVIGGISINKFLQLPFPLPPLAEQQRIVAKVDELMALCDRLQAARAGREAVRDRLTAATLAGLTAPETDAETFPTPPFQTNARFALQTLTTLTTRPGQIKALRQTILNLAVRGKLLAQDPTDEPAAELLKRIAKERNAATKAKSVRRNGNQDLDSLSAESHLPQSWVWTDLDQIALSMRYGTSIKCEHATKGVPVLRIPNVSGGTVSLGDMKYGPLSPSEIEDLALRVGDILMIRSNGSLDIVGRSAVVPAEADGMAFAGYLVRLRLSQTLINATYIWFVLNSSDIREQIEKPIRSAVGLKNINLTEFGNLTIPLPPLAEQHRIVAKVDALMALCDQLEASLTTATTTRSRLLEALLHEALDGALGGEAGAAA